MTDKQKLIDNFKGQNNIVDVARNNGYIVNKNNKTLCPFHEDHDPSNQLYPESNKFKCFACGKYGDVLDLVQQYTGKTLNETIGYDIDSKETKIAEYIKNKFNTSKKGYSFNRVHFYHDEKGDIISAKIIFKDSGNGDKDALQVNIKDNWKVEFGEIKHNYLFNLPGILSARVKNKPIFLVEGEKDAETLIRRGFIATTTRDGASSWKADYNKYLAGNDIIIIGDNDSAGRKYVDTIKKELLTKSKSFKIIELPELQEKQDITDWFENGHTKDELKNILKDTLDSKLQYDINKYDFTDLGIAERFKDIYKDILKYSIDTKYYFTWNNKYWGRYDDELPIKSLAIEFVRELERKINKYITYLDAKNEDDNKKIDFFRKTINKLKSNATFNKISDTYKAFKDTNILSSGLDKDIKYINCKNGIVDTETGELLPHNKDLYITKYVDVDYIKGKVNALYKGTVERLFMGDNEEVKAFEMLLGYMLSGKANQKKFPIIAGGKDSGKSKIFEIIRLVYGEDYVVSIDKSLLMRAWDKQTGASPELVELQGVRLLLCSETSDSDYINTDFAKRIVGGDPIKARPLFKPLITFRPIFTPVIFTNEKPKINGNDDALVKRIISIDLKHPLKKEEINTNFENDVLEDKEGVFSYLVSCIVSFNKLNKLLIPKCWDDSATEYMTENNPYLEFKNEYLDVLEGHDVKANEVYRIFEIWYRENHSNNVPTPTKVTKELKKIGIKSIRKNGTVYKDIVINVDEKELARNVSTLYRVK